MKDTRNPPIWFMSFGGALVGACLGFVALTLWNSRHQQEVSPEQRFTPQIRLHGLGWTKGLILTNETAVANGYAPSVPEQTWPKAQTNVALDEIIGDAPARLLGRTNVPTFVFREPSTGIEFSGFDPYKGSIVITGRTIGTFSSNRWQWADGIVLGVVTNVVKEVPAMSPPGSDPTHLLYYFEIVTNRVVRFTLPNGETKEVPF